MRNCPTLIRHMPRLLALSMALSFCFCLATDADEVTPINKYSGIGRQDGLAELAPKNGMITSQAELNRIWAGWSVPQPIPDVDFATQMVLVTTVPGPNRTFNGPLNLEDGDLSYRVAATRMGGPGFGYLMMVVPRARIESVNGQPVPKFQPPADQPNEIADAVNVEVIGKLQTGVMAIGGETTGTTITANGITWELDLQNAEQINLAKSLAEQDRKTRVRGSLLKVEGIEIKVRFIVLVNAISPADQPNQPANSRSANAKPPTGANTNMTRTRTDPNDLTTPRSVPLDQLKPVTKQKPTRQVMPPEKPEIDPATLTGFKSIKITMSGPQVEGKITHQVAPSGLATIDDGKDPDQYQIPASRLKLLHEHIARTNWNDVPRLNRGNQPDAMTFDIEIRTKAAIHRVYLQGDRLKDVPEISILFRLLRK